MWEVECIAEQVIWRNLPSRRSRGGHEGELVGPGTILRWDTLHSAWVPDVSGVR
jgi:hypothetical protein